MDDFFSSMNMWHWYIFGFALMAVEIFIPGAFFLWPGLAALAVGGVVMMLDLHWSLALSLWAALSVVTVLIWAIFRRKYPKTGESGLFLNRRGQEFIGQTLLIDTPISQGKGEVHTGGTIWKVVCIQDVSPGTSVIVTAVEGSSLRVVPKDQENA